MIDHRVTSRDFDRNIGGMGQEFCKQSTGPVGTARDISRARRRPYSNLDPQPLTEEEVRNLPVAHQYSS